MVELVISLEEAIKKGFRKVGSQKETRTFEIPVYAYETENRIFLFRLDKTRKELKYFNDYAK